MVAMRLGMPSGDGYEFGCGTSSTTLTASTTASKLGSKRGVPVGTACWRPCAHLWTWIHLQNSGATGDATNADF
jgi:hypothetical protein